MKGNYTMRKLLTALCTIAILVSVTACSSGNIGDILNSNINSSVEESSKEETTTESETSAPDETSKPETTTETESSVPDETSGKESETSKPGEELSLSFENDKFRITANEAWKPTSTIGTDCAYQYISGDVSTAGTIIGVQTADTGITISSEDFAKQMIEMYEKIESYTVESQKAVKVNGLDAYEIKLTMGTMDLVLDQTIVVKDKTAYVFHITYIQSSYKTVAPEIKKVLDTFEFVG